jgi:hypothetical protein
VVLIPQCAGHKKPGPVGWWMVGGLWGGVVEGHYGGLDRSVERVDQGGYAGVEEGEV